MKFGLVPMVRLRVLTSGYLRKQLPAGGVTASWEQSPGDSWRYTESSLNCALYYVAPQRAVSDVVDGR